MSAMYQVTGPKSDFGNQVSHSHRRNDPDRLVLRKFDPVARGHVEFREDH
ncbi:hypothetical protein UO65_4658 [Actinokineospora spheciospongiae]|uniref:Large ribosomal subunit protein bL33 n=1 Tax=Actinokineospora spheciospongiae TaxID=909613 RepID=W7ITM7_9PSEU|nr:hypothetical protein UO65_4658 [Actinokineospora spheciospongiae]